MLILIMSLAFLPLASLADQASFVFTGRGYGHGLGLSQYGAKGFAEKRYLYNKILGTYFKNTALKKNSAKIIRILVSSNRPIIEFGAIKNFTLISEPLKKKYRFSGGQRYQTKIEKGRLLIKNLKSGKTLGRYTAPLRLEGGNGQRLFTTDDNGYRNNIYRGSLHFVVKNNRVQVVDYINAEHYLFGVVTREMPAGWPMEALKSQAVSARSYTYASLKPNNYFDLYATTLSQVYGGLKAETAQSINAVKSTSNLVLTYQGKIIQAFYHSNSGGVTENNENVWGGTPIAWLRAAKSPYEGNSVVWLTNPSFSREFVQGRLGVFSSNNLSGVKGTLKDLVVTKRAVSPRVSEVKIIGSKGDSYISGDKLRKALRLRSTWFYVNGK